MKVEDVRVFIPSKDYEVSIRFYQDLGFVMERASDDLSIFKSNGYTFFLTRHYDAEMKTNVMLQIVVSDIAEIFNKLAELTHYDIDYQPIKEEAWGKVIYLSGPSKELWHITELNPVEN